jgi:hypothetical protein
MTEKQIHIRIGMRVAAHDRAEQKRRPTPSCLSSASAVSTVRSPSPVPSWHIARVLAAAPSADRRATNICLHLASCQPPPDPLSTDRNQSSAE